MPIQIAVGPSGQMTRITMVGSDAAISTAPSSLKELLGMTRAELRFVSFDKKVDIPIPPPSEVVDGPTSP